MSIPNLYHSTFRMNHIYLVSYASIRPEEFTVVSQETPNPNHPGEIKLPDVCNAFGTRCIFLQNMFREITETF